MAVQIRVDGAWLSSVAWWGEPKITHRWPFGCWETTWSMNLEPNQRPAMLRRGAPIDVFHGAVRIWTGELTEPDWDSGEFVAQGLCRQAEGALCLTSAGAATTNPVEAVDEARARGALTWALRDDGFTLASAAFEDVPATGMPLYLRPLLDAAANETGDRWTVGPNARVTTSADPTLPTWYVMPETVTLGVADEDFVTDVYGRYQVTAGVYATAHVGDSTQAAGRREIAVDLTDKGAIGTTRATDIVTGILNKTKARTGWTNGIRVTENQITTPGGTPASFSMVKAGQMVRLLGLLDPRGAATSTDIILGETIWEPDTTGQGVITLNPVGLAARDLASIVEAAGATLSAS